MLGQEHNLMLDFRNFKAHPVYSPALSRRSENLGSDAEHYWYVIISHSVMNGHSEHCEFQ